MYTKDENGSRQHQFVSEEISKAELSGFGGLEDACWPLVPKFAGSNPAEAVGFFKLKNSPVRLPSEGK
jgi:hypothetical protein